MVGRVYVPSGKASWQGPFIIYKTEGWTQWHNRINDECELVILFATRFGTNIYVNYGRKICPNCLGVKSKMQNELKPPARIGTEHAQFPINTHSHLPWQSSDGMRIVVVHSKIISNNHKQINGMEKHPTSAVFSTFTD